MTIEENDKTSSVFKSDYYFQLDDALEDVKNEFQIGNTTDKAKASARLLGKTAFNVGLFVGKVGVKAAKHLPQILVKAAEQELKTNPNLSDERRETLQKIVEKNNH